MGLLKKGPVRISNSSVFLYFILSFLYVYFFAGAVWNTKCTGGLKCLNISPLSLHQLSAL